MSIRYWYNLRSRRHVSWDFDVIHGMAIGECSSVMDILVREGTGAGYPDLQEVQRF
jgi:hypothetical protein